MRTSTIILPQVFENLCSICSLLNLLVIQLLDNKNIVCVTSYIMELADLQMNPIFILLIKGFNTRTT